MKNFQKIFAVALSVMLLLCSLPLVTLAEDTVAIPEMNNTYNVVEAVEGKVMEATYAANANAYFADRKFTQFGPFNCTDAVYLELDVYTSVETNVSGEINLTTTAENPNKKAAYIFGTLNKGWNHKVFTLRAGTVDVADIGAAFLAGVFSETEEAHVIVANIAFTTDMPAVNNTYTAVVTRTGLLNSGTVPANTNAWNTCLANTNFADTDITGANFVEMDIYVSAPVNDSEGETAEINLGYGFNDVANKNNYTFPALNTGWNHVVFELKANNLNYGKLNNAFMACVFSTDSDVEFKIANLSFTTSKPPIPEVNNTYYAVATIIGKLNGGTVPANTNAWDSCLARADFADIDITSAKYVEMDIYVSAPVNDSEGENAEINLGYGFNDVGNKNNYIFPALSVGWNHVVFELGANNLNYGKLNNAFMACTFSTDSNVEFEIANLSFTKFTPNMNNVHYEVASKVGDLMEATYAANADAYSNGNQFRTFGPFDCTNAEYLELDIYTSAEINVSGEINLSDGTDNALNKAAYNFGTLQKGWNHKVFDLRTGSLDPVQIGSAFLAGVFSETEEAHIIIANIAFTKFAPDANYTHTLVEEHTYISENGEWEDGLTISIQYEEPSNYTKGDHLEFDFYVESAPCEDLLFTVYEGENYCELTVGDLKEGWNHIVIATSDISGINFKAVTMVEFIHNFEGTARTAIANFALTAEETVKGDIDYKGTPYAVYSGYNNVTVLAGSDIADTDVIALPIPANLNDVDYIEFNIYVSVACNIVLNVNSTPVEYGEADSLDSAYKTLEGLTYGWNQVSIRVEDILNFDGWNANDWFEPTAITNIYLSGILSTDSDIVVAVEDFALTVSDIDYTIADGDYNADGNIDILDLIFVKNEELNETDNWFANVAEFDICTDGIINAIDFTALRKQLFASF